MDQGDALRFPLARIWASECLSCLLNGKGNSASNFINSTSPTENWWRTALPVLRLREGVTDFFSRAVRMVSGETSAIAAASFTENSSAMEVSAINIPLQVVLFQSDRKS